ncbi:MAG: endonuclease/exonuclease/phosphatase family protein [Pseudomonadota bacterium]
MKTSLATLCFLLSCVQSFAATDEQVTAAYSQNQERYTESLTVFEEQVDHSHQPNSARLRLVTFNLGMLEFPTEVPNFSQRSALLESYLGEYLKSENPDILFLQEAWGDKEENISIIRELAKQHGYISLQDSNESRGVHGGFWVRSKQRNTGLETLVKESLLAEEPELEVGFSFATRSSLEWSFRIRRGLLHAKFTLKSGHRVMVANSHFTPNLGGPWYDQNSTRLGQVADASEHLSELATDVDYVFYGADMNFSPEFEHKVQDGRELDGTIEGWTANRQSYVDFVSSTQLVDSYGVANEDKGYTQDRVANPVTNVSGSTDGEPEQRLDYVWVGSYTGAGYKIESSNLVFDEPVVNEEGASIQAEAYEGDLYWSDHFGVGTIVLLPSVQKESTESEE